jgi:hypothetical protein
MRPILSLALLAALSLAAPALADGPIATATGAGSAAPQPATPPPPLPLSDASFEGGPQVAMGPCGPEKVRPDGKLETAPHGEVEVGVGSQGYRRVAAAVCQPIGQNAAVAVSVSDTQGQTPLRRR